ncbi:MAG: hypothetical protein AAFU79_22555 [Myxococcota bacterium]
MVTSLAGQLGMGEVQAKGLAGGLLGIVKAGVEQQMGSEAAAKLEASVPEMKSWQDEGDTPEGQPGVHELLGGLAGGNLGELGDLGSVLGNLGGLGGMLGGAAQTAGLAGAVGGLVEQFGLDGHKATMAGGIVAQFLESRLDPDMLGQLRPILALLSGATSGGGDGGGLGGMLGGLLG